MQVLRSYEVPTRERREAFGFELDVADERARVELVETVRVDGRGYVRTHGSLWVRDLGELEYSRDPETGLETPKSTKKLALVAVPLFSRHQFRIPGECGEMLGTFRDDESQWMLFLRRRRAASPSPAPGAGSKGPQRAGSPSGNSSSTAAAGTPGPSNDGSRPRSDPRRA